MTNEHLHELTAAYALDALDADERQRVRSAPAGRASSCRAELAELSETVGSLALAAEGPAPPEGLRDRILVAAREEPPNVVALRPRRTRLWAGVRPRCRRLRCACGRSLGRALGREGPDPGCAPRRERHAGGALVGESRAFGLGPGRCSGRKGIRDLGAAGRHGSSGRAVPGRSRHVGRLAHAPGRGGRARGGHARAGHREGQADDEGSLHRPAVRVVSRRSSPLDRLR